MKFEDWWEENSPDLIEHLKARCEKDFDPNATSITAFVAVEIQPEYGSPCNPFILRSFDEEREATTRYYEENIK